jgi:hypothetical protein
MEPEISDYGVLERQEKIKLAKAFWAMFSSEYNKAIISDTLKEIENFIFIRDFHEEEFTYEKVFQIKDIIRDVLKTYSIKRKFNFFSFFPLAIQDEVIELISKEKFIEILSKKIKSEGDPSLFFSFDGDLVYSSHELRQLLLSFMKDYSDYLSLKKKEKCRFNLNFISNEWEKKYSESKENLQDQLRNIVPFLKNFILEY